MPQAVFEHALLGGNLRCVVRVLHAATAADAEIGTAGRRTVGRCPQDMCRLRLLVGGLPAVAGVFDFFTR